ncbi:MAG: HAD hydrolase-like protein, partial [Candidatus Limnocylindria bacterium]
ALAALDVGPHEAAMVGDSVERDVAAARAAGVYAVWLDRGSGPLASAGARVQSSAAEKRAGSSVRAREGLTGPTGADARITSLRELPALLAGLPRPPVSPRDSRGPRPE